MFFPSPDDLARHFGLAREHDAPPPTGSRTILIFGGGPDERLAESGRLAAALAREAGCGIWLEDDPAGWPFALDVAARVPSGPVVAWVNDVERAFPAIQTGGTRLLLAQPTYLVQKIVDRLAAWPRSRIVLTGDEDELLRVAMDAFTRRGPFESVALIRLAAVDDRAGGPRVAARQALAEGDLDEAERMLRSAFRDASPVERLERCRSAARMRPGWPVAWLALGSACMEQQTLDEARDALDRAASLAPESEAVHFERGKLWLRLDDIPRASEAFARAGELMPTLAAAFSNLGATLGELDRPDEALRAFRHALAHDPYSFTILNNIGVVSRETGDFDASERALRRVIEIAPDFVFGHYNLGHTLFLQGRFADARDAYQAGQQRDAARQPRQACRLALCRLAAGDPNGALADLQASVAPLAREARLDLFTEAREILQALLASRPDLPGGRELRAMIATEIASLRRQ